MTDARNTGDRGLERLLREGLPPADAGDVAACLDVDSLAAWIDNALTPGERAAAEAHAAGCARCQSMLAVMIRTAPVEAAAEGSAIRRWTMMFAPALAAAAAVVLWFAVESPPQSDAPAAERAATVPSAVGEPPVVPAPATAAPASPADAPMTHAAKEEAELMLADALRKSEDREQRSPPSSSATRSAGVRRAPAENSADKAREAAAEAVADARGAGSGLDAAPLAAGAAPKSTPPPASPPSAGVAETVAIQTPTAQARQDERLRQAAPMPSATQAAPQATQQQPNPPASQQRPDQQQAAGFTARDAAAPQPRTETDVSARAGAGAGRGGAAETPQVSALRYAAARTQETIAFRSADGDGWWRITGGRVVEASTDKGTTWSMRFAGDEKTVLAAGSAASSSTVWIVGRAGLVLLTTDGRAWRRLPFPETADLIAVTAADARHATVIAADGRAFSTADAGASWVRRQP